MTQKVVGSCSICGGAVCVPTIWHGVYPPTPQCIACNAVASPPMSRPVIPMQPQIEPWWNQNPHGNSEHYVGP